jgi:hypothetical protein
LFVICGGEGRRKMWLINLPSGARRVEGHLRMRGGGEGTEGELYFTKFVTGNARRF